MKLRNIIFILIGLTIFSYFVLANSSFQTIVLLTPTNASYDADGSVVFVFNVTGNTSLPYGYSCTLYTNNSGSWASSGNTNSNVTNNTRGNMTQGGLSDGHLGWNVGCTSPGNSTVVFPTNRILSDVGSAVNNTVIVDSVAPRINLNSPTNRSWHRSGINVLFNITPSDENPGYCWLGTNLNESSNTSGSGSLFFNQTANWTSFVSNTSIPFLFGNRTLVSWLDNNTGAYLYNFGCNDTVGNVRRMSTINMTFFVDSVAPTQPNITYPLNNSFTTDLTTLIQFLNATETNFSLYQVLVDNNTDFSSPEFEINITTAGSNATLVASGNLSYNRRWYVRVNTFDIANNSATSNGPYSYSTDSTCGVMVADSWNICAMINNQTTINASTLCTQTSCTYISMYNASHQFQTHTVGSATNDEMLFISPNGWGRINSSAVAFIYVTSTNRTWENRSWGEDFGASTPANFMNLTNASTGWNIVPILNRTANFTLGSLDRSINGNGTSFLLGNYSRFMSFYTNEAGVGSRFVPFVANRSINNFTVIDYGSAVWIHLNRSIDGFLWNSSGEIS